PCRSPRAPLGAGPGHTRRCLFGGALAHPGILLAGLLGRLLVLVNRSDEGGLAPRAAHLLAPRGLREVQPPLALRAGHLDGHGCILSGERSIPSSMFRKSRPE